MTVQFVLPATDIQAVLDVAASLPRDKLPDLITMLVRMAAMPDIVIQHDVTPHSTQKTLPAVVSLVPSTLPRASSPLARIPPSRTPSPGPEAPFVDSSEYKSSHNFFVGRGEKIIARSLLSLDLHKRDPDAVRQIKSGAATLKICGRAQGIQGVALFKGRKVKFEVVSAACTFNEQYQEWSYRESLRPLGSDEGETGGECHRYLRRNGTIFFQWGDESC